MLQTLVPPSGLPLDLADVRLHLRQDLQDDDPLLRLYLQAAALHAEAQVERALLATRFRLVLDAFPCSGQFGMALGNAMVPANAIQIPRTPLLNLGGIEYLDMAGTWQTMPPSDYTLDDSGPVPRITPVFGKIWPIPLPQMGAVRVTFDAGYATPCRVDGSGGIVVGLWKPLAVGDAIRFSNSGGALPAPLLADVDYYVQSVAGQRISVAEQPGGAAIALTDAGTGSHYVGAIPEGIKAWMLMRVGALYENREEVAVMHRGQIQPLPFVDGLLDPYRVVTY